MCVLECVHVCVSVCMCMHVCVSVCMCVLECVCMCMCLFVCACMHVCVCLYVCAWVCVWSLHLSLWISLTILLTLLSPPFWNTLQGAVKVKTLVKHFSSYSALWSLCWQQVCHLLCFLARSKLVPLSLRQNAFYRTKELDGQIYNFYEQLLNLCFVTINVNIKHNYKDFNNFVPYYIYWIHSDFIAYDICRTANVFYLKQAMHHSHVFCIRSFPWESVNQLLKIFYWCQNSCDSKKVHPADTILDRTNRKLGHPNESMSLCHYALWVHVLDCHNMYLCYIVVIRLYYCALITVL